MGRRPKLTAQQQRETIKPVWRLPLCDPYDKLLEGKTADLNNLSGGLSFCAAAWAHFDFHARTPKAKPGRPEDAEVLAARQLYALLEACLGEGGLGRATMKRGGLPVCINFGTVI